MTSLAEVYEGLGEDASYEQLVAGTGLFAAGALLVIAGIVVATTNVLAVVGVENWWAYEPAGILAGLGLPAVFVGIFVVLPASRRVRAAAAIGAAVAVLGVILFEYAFPNRWTGDPTNLTALVTGVYFAGAITTFACLFWAVATFKTRNDPGGTVRLEVTREGETRVVEVDRDDLGDAIEGAKGDISGKGGIGVLGNDPDGEVPTQTNRPDRNQPSTAGANEATVGDRGYTSTRRRTSSGRGSAGGPSLGSGGGNGTPASDGGATEPGVRSPIDDAEVMRTTNPVEATDSYCGNCKHFQYVRTSRGMRPFCEFHDGVMDDMDACDDWTPNNQP